MEKNMWFRDARWIYLSDTIANNIGVSDERPNMEKINYAAEISKYQ